MPTKNKTVLNYKVKLPTVLGTDLVCASYGNEHKCS